MESSAAGKAAPFTHRPWSTVLLTANALGAATGLAAVVTGVALLAARGSESDGPGEGSTDGWAGFVGPVLVLIGLVVGIAAVFLLVDTARGRREADDGDARTLRGTAVMAVVLGAVAIVVTLPLSLFVVPAPLLVLAIVHVTAAAKIAAATRPGTPRDGDGRTHPSVAGGLPLPQGPPRD